MDERQLGLRLKSLPGRLLLPYTTLVQEADLREQDA